MNITGTLLGEVELNKHPTVDMIISIRGHDYKVVDWSIDQRRIDELYVR